MTTPQTLALKLALGALALVAAFGAGCWLGYSLGRDRADADCATAETTRLSNELIESKKDRDEARRLSAEYLTQVSSLEEKYAVADRARKAALDSKVTCPASGRVGDVRLPRAVVRSMFPSVAPADAASRPARVPPP